LSVGFTFGPSPLCPRKRTNNRCLGKPALCQLRLGAPQQKHRYSIISSARASSVGGTSRPSAFAVAVFIPRDRLQFCIGLTRL
jgi:hypothetical protein